ncbi:MAG: MBL fold metallo-hydrolase [Candidatus Sericytochromatia bacterium]|nr:MBL fold metallo-hydrolase [Candidatus Sericytochromatia bacterium]
MSASYSLTFLGVGAGLSPELGNNNVLIEQADGPAHLLVDCGPVTAQLLKASGRLPDIRHAVLTHVHDDHVGGLQLWAQLNRYVYRHRPTLWYPEALWDELWEGTLRGGLERVNAADGMAGTAGLDAYFDLRPLKPGESLALPGLPALTMRPTVHVPGKPCFGFYLGRDVYYSSDSQLMPPFEGIDGAPLRAIFQDCQLFDSPYAVHTSFNTLVRDLPDHLKPITRLMHYNEPPSLDAQAEGFWGFVPRHEKLWL